MQIDMKFSVDVSHASTAVNLHAYYAPSIEVRIELVAARRVYKGEIRYLLARSQSLEAQCYR